MSDFDPAILANMTGVPNLMDEVTVMAYYFIGELIFK